MANPFEQSLTSLFGSSCLQGQNSALSDLHNAQLQQQMAIQQRLIDDQYRCLVEGALLGAGVKRPAQFMRETEPKPESLRAKPATFHQKLRAEIEDWLPNLSE